MANLFRVTSYMYWNFRECGVRDRGLHYRDVSEWPCLKEVRQHLKKKVENKFKITIAIFGNPR